MKWILLERVLLIALVVASFSSCTPASPSGSGEVVIRTQGAPAPFTDVPTPGTYEVQIYTGGQIQTNTVSGVSYALITGGYSESAQGLKIRLGSGLMIANLNGVQSSRHPAYRSIYTLTGSGTVSIERSR